MSSVFAPLAAIFLVTDQGAAPLPVISVVLALVVLVLVPWYAAEPIEDRAGDREKRWYPQLKF
jgi:hypothetical protein